MSLMFWAQMVGKPVMAPAPAASPAAAPAPFSSFRRLIFRRDAPARIFATDLSSIENAPHMLRAVIAPSVGYALGRNLSPLIFGCQETRPKPSCADLIRASLISQANGRWPGQARP